MQNKSLLVGLGALLAVIIVGGFLIFGRGSQTQPVPTPVSPEIPKVEEKMVAPEAEEAVEEPREIVVSGSEYSFDPSSMTVAAGEKIKLTFKNTGSLPHNWTIDELGVATKTISAGQTDTIEFTVAMSGIYTPYCNVSNHRQLGMEGVLEVK